MNQTSTVTRRWAALLQIVLPVIVLTATGQIAAAVAVDPAAAAAVEAVVAAVPDAAALAVVVVAAAVVARGASIKSLTG
jgi:hypothetical protein